MSASIKEKKEKKETKKVIKDTTSAKKKTIKNTKTPKNDDINDEVFNEEEYSVKMTPIYSNMSENDKKLFIKCVHINYGDDEYLLDEKTNNIYTIPNAVNYYFVGKKTGDTINFDENYLKLKKVIDERNGKLKNKSFSIGDKVFYTSENKEAIIKEIQNDGMYVLDANGDKITTLAKNIQSL